MEVTEGSLSWAATIDDSQMLDASERIEEYFRSIGMSASEANTKTEEAMRMMAKAVNDAMEEAGSGADAIDVLNTAIESMKKQLETIPDGDMRQTLEGVVQGFEDVRDEMSRTIQETGQLGDSFGKASDILVRLLGGTENYSKIISGLPGPLRSAISGIQGMTTAARAFIATPLGAVIAAIVAALQAMRAWLTSSAEGQMRLAETTGYLKGILGQLKEIVISIGEWLVKAFDDPKQALKDLGTAIRDNLMNRLKAVGEISQAIGKILKSAFTFDWDGLKEGTTELMGSLVQFGTGIDKLKLQDKIIGIGEAASEKARIERERKELEVEQSKWQVRRAELEKMMADASTKMYNTSLASSERKKALDEYKKYNQEILDSEQAMIDKRIDLQKRDMALTTNSIEDENTLRKLQADRWRIQQEASQRLASLQRRENSIVNAGESAAKKTREQELKASSELLKLKQSNREKELQTMRDGYAKELEAAKVAYDNEIENIGKLERKWKEAQSGVLSEEQQAEIDNAMRLANDTLVKSNAEVLREMLSEYGDYTAQKEEIDRTYYDNIALLDKMLAETTTENQRKAIDAARGMAGMNRAKALFDLGIDVAGSKTYGSVEEQIKAINDVYNEYIAELDTIAGQVAARIDEIQQKQSTLDITDPEDIAEIEKLNEEIERLKGQFDTISKAKAEQARETLELTIGTIDTKAYATVEERMNAINKAYDTYIKSLEAAGAGEAEITSAKAEQADLTGKIATLEATIAQLEERKKTLDITDPKDIADIEKLNKEIARLQKEIERLTKKSGSKGIWSDFVDSLDVSEAVGWLNGIGDAITRIGEAAGDTSVKDAGEAISGIANAVQGVAQGFAQGGIIGAAISLATTIGNEVVEFIAAEQRMQGAIEQANFDKFVNDQREILAGRDSLFGTDRLGDTISDMDVIIAATKKLRDLENEIIANDESEREKFFADNNTKARNISYQNAVAKGQEGLAAVQVNVADYSGFANFFGIADEFKSLQDAAEELGYTLYGDDGVLNKDALQAIIDTYEDLSEEDRVWIQKMIDDLGLYEDAVDEMADYLKSIFDSVGDSIADKMLETYLESGEAAMDFGELTSNVAKQMAKDFVKSMLMDEVFSSYEQGFKDIIANNSLNPEEKQKQMLVYFQAMMGEAEKLQPEIQAYLDTMSQFFGKEAEMMAEAKSGNLLQTASQDSVSLLNGQLNAVRTNQQVHLAMIDGILMQLAGIRTDMNDGFDRSVEQLEQIKDNTSEHGSILRGFGLG